jgi:hypothetical protein
MEDVMAYGGITSPATEFRSSERIRQQYNADATQLDRVQQLAQAKDAGFLQGTSSISKYSISSMPDEFFVQRVRKMGVSLEVDENQVAASIHNMKKIDHNRTLIVLSKNVEDKNK